MATNKEATIQHELLKKYDVEEWTEYGGYKIAILSVQHTKHDLPVYYFAIFKQNGELVHKSLQDGGGFDQVKTATEYAMLDIERFLPDPNANPTIEFELVPGVPDSSGRYLIQLSDNKIISTIYAVGDKFVFDYEENKFRSDVKAWLKVISD